MEDITNQLAEELKKGVESVYHPFLCTLPSDVTFIPAMWSEAKILDMDIGGTQIESDLRNMRNKWNLDAEKYCTESKREGEGKGEGVTAADWVWARATLQARGFSFRPRGGPDKPIKTERDTELVNAEVEGGDKAVIVSFIPFITLSNHDDEQGGVTTMGTDSKGPTFTFRTGPSRIEGRQQIFNYYGAISFQQKILSFGWVDRCPADSPEGFCITALDIPLGPMPMGAGGVSSTTLHESQATRSASVSMEVEIKSNVLLAAGMAYRNRAGEPQDTVMSNDLSLKITILKFEIRTIIRKIEERGVGRDRAVQLLEDALRERMKRLSEKSTAHSATQVQSPVLNKQISKGKGQGQPKPRPKTRTKSTAVPSRESESDQWEKERASQSDGQCIRRVELEAVQLLLLYVPTC